MEGGVSQMEQLETAVAKVEEVLAKIDLLVDAPLLGKIANLTNKERRNKEIIEALVQLQGCLEAARWGGLVPFAFSLAKATSSVTFCVFGSPSFNIYVFYSQPSYRNKNGVFYEDLRHPRFHTSRERTTGRFVLGFRALTSDKNRDAPPTFPFCLVVEFNPAMLISVNMTVI
jgi:hypothetical protein